MIRKCHPTVAVGMVLMLLGTVLACSHFGGESSSEVMQFIRAAAPYVLLGLGVALTLGGAVKKD